MVTVDDLADRFVDDLAGLDPCAATAMGITDHDGELTNYSPEGLAARAELARRLLADLTEVPVASDHDRVAAAVMGERVEIELQLHGAGLRLGELNTVDGPLQQLRRAFDLMDADDQTNWWAIAMRLRGLPDALAGYRTSLLRSASSGSAAAVRQVRSCAGQCQRWTGSLAELVGRYGDGPLRGDLDRSLMQANAALIAFARFLGEELAPVAPRRDAAGRERYALWSRYFTGAQLDLDETYAWGWEELARIKAKMDQVAQRLAPGEPLDAVISALDRDPARFVVGPDNAQAWMQELADRTLDALADVHFDVPEPLRRLECRVTPVGAGWIYYTPPSEDFIRPGRVWWTVADQDQRLVTWQAVTTVHHEGVPGHHLQLGHTVYRADRLNRYQRLACQVPGHAEGWALYAERLMAELGYLDDPAEHLGMLQSQAFRAARVVVDLGMHLELEIPSGTGFHEAEPWTPELGREFLRDYCIDDPFFVDHEIDRYLGRPGQAMSYKVGERVWLTAREERRGRLRNAFDLKAFHAAALDLGPMGLDTLRSQLARI